MYPTMEQVTEQWRDTLSGKPFEVTHAAAGHMKWGVGYEDPALIHFAVDTGLTVVQVGTIHLPLSYILGLTSETDDLLARNVAYLRGHHCYSETNHLLVSPDGVVGLKELISDGQPDWYQQLPKEIVGMLEIKCISPFHHVEEGREEGDKTGKGYLTWVDDMETRQWFHPGQIPFVYITQICLQAIAGIYRLDMTTEDTMWFIRWSPKGWSEFKISFEPLVKMGIVATMLYYRLKWRLKDISDVAEEIVYTAEELNLSRALCAAYQNVLSQMTHRYVDHSRLYPEFEVYRRCTEFHHFVVE